MAWTNGNTRDSGALVLVLALLTGFATGVFAPSGGLDRFGASHFGAGHFRAFQFGAVAAELDRTTPGHMSPSRRDRSFKWKTEPFNKPQIDPFKAGVIWRADGPFSKHTRFEGELSRACREGLFARRAGGFGDFEDVRVPAAPVAGVYNPTRLILRYPIYFFRYESTTRCQVYRPR